MFWRTLLSAELLALALALVPAARAADPYVVAGAWGAPGRTTAGIAPDVPIAVRRLLADADGTIMISGGNQVLRVDPRGRLTVFAGTRHTGDSGDGGPATAATLAYAGGMARDPAGALLVVSGGELRRITPDGRIATVAGRGPLEPPPLGEPIPATRAAVSISDVAVTPGGRVLAADGDAAAPLLELLGDGTLRALPAPPGSDDRCQYGGVLAVLPAGGLLRGGVEDPVVCTIGDAGPWRVLIAREGPVAAHLRNVADLCVLPDGSVLVTDVGDHEPSRLLRFAAGAVRATQISLAGDGVNLPLSFNAQAAVAAPDGGLLVASDRQVVYLPPARPGRLALRFEPRATGIGLRATLPGHVRLQVGKRTLEAELPAGTRTLRLPGRIVPGLYRVHATLRAPSGAVTSASTRLVLGGRLTDAALRAVLHTGRAPIAHAADEFWVNYPDRCRRFSALRVDCEVITQSESTGESDCLYIAAVLLRRDGTLRKRRYGCARHERFRAHARWGRPARVDMLGDDLE